MDARRSGNRIRILLATDDSPAARDAEAWALRLHAPAGGRLIEVATVAQGSLALGWQAQTYRDAVQEAVAGLREVEVQDAERVANAVGERLQSQADVVVHTWARSGDVLAALLALATETDPDLVAVGHRGRSALVELVLGSVARGMVDQGTCPTLVARGAPAGDPAPAHPLLVIDGSPESEDMVNRVAELGIMAGADAVLLDILLPEDAVEGRGRPEAVQGLARARESMQDRLVERLREGLGTVTVRTELGDPAATVRAVARDEGTDLVVIPRTTRHRAGSLADRLIHGAQTSVLVVPAA
jgi:nucleotide-binding universal stress UspA family protein